MSLRFPSVRRFRRLVQLLGLLIAVGAGSLPLSVSTAYAQAARPWAWAATIQHPTLNGYVQGGQTATDAAGNQYITGSFAGTVAFGTTTLTSRKAQLSDLFVAKISPAGQWLWAVSPTATTGPDIRLSQSIDVAVDPQGTVVVLGTYMGDLTLGGLALPGPVISTQSVLVARISPQGQWLSAAVATTNVPVPPGPSGLALQATSLAVDQQGNAYVVGTGPHQIAFGSITLNAQLANYGQNFVASVGANGQWRWAMPVGNFGDAIQVEQLATGPQGDVWLAGGFYSTTATFGATVITNVSTSNWSQDLFVARLSSAGQWLGAYAAGGTGHDAAYGLVVDAQNNAYVTGYYEQAASFGSQSVVSPHTQSPGGGSVIDAFLARLDAGGQWAWARSGGGEYTDVGRNVALDAQGDVYWTGSYTSTAVFGLTTLSVSNPAYDTRSFFAKLSPAGLWRWTVGAPLAGGWSGNQLAPDPQGGVRVGTTYNGSATAALGTNALDPPAKTNVLAAHLSATGQWDWARNTESGGEAVVRHVVSDAQGTTYVTGRFAGTVAIGGTTFTSRGYTDGFVACYNRQGQPQWAVQLGTAAPDMGQRIALDPRGGVVVSGASGDTLVLGADVVPGSLSGYYNASTSAGFLARLSAQGQVLGGTRAPHTLANLVVAANGDAVLTGSSTDTLRIGTVATFAARGYDAFVARLSATNQWQWAQQLGGNGAASDYAADLALDSIGNAYTLGNFTDTLVLGGTTLLGSATHGSYLASLDGAGQWRWARTIVANTFPPASASASGTGLALAPGGTHLLVTGYFYDTLTLGPSFLRAALNKESAFVGELSLAGQWLGANRPDGSGSTYGGPIAGGGPLTAGAPATSYVLGSVRGVARFGTDSIVGPERAISPSEPLANGSNSLARRRRADQESRWSAGLAGERGGPPLPTQPIPFVAAFTGAGLWQWGQLAPGALTLASNPAGDLFLGGALGQPTDDMDLAYGYLGDSIYTVGAFTYTPKVLATGFVTAMLGGPLGLTAAAAASRRGLDVWPNPAHRTVQLRDWPVGATTVRLLDAQGREVLRRVLSPAGVADITLALPALAPGLYVVECGGAHQRLVVE